VFFGFANSQLTRPQGLDMMGGVMCVDEDRMLVPLVLVTLVHVLRGGEQKGLEHRKTKLRCEDRPHLRHYTAARFKTMWF
jgi:hypothetical protein